MNTTKYDAYSIFNVLKEEGYRGLYRGINQLANKLLGYRLFSISILHPLVPYYLLATLRIAEVAL